MPVTLPSAHLSTGLSFSCDLRAGGASYIGSHKRLWQAGLQSPIRTPASLGLLLCSLGGSHGGARLNSANEGDFVRAATCHVRRSAVCLAKATINANSWGPEWNQFTSKTVLTDPCRREKRIRRGQCVRCQASDRPSSDQTAGGPITSDDGGGARVQKVCLVCGVSKPLRNFGDSVSSVDKRQDLCRACNARSLAEQSGKDLHHLAKPVAEAWAQARMCHRCKQVQELRDFTRNLKYKDGLERSCRSCNSERWKKSPHWPRAETARCACCKEEKPGSAFWRKKQNRNGLASYCKACTLEVEQAYHAKVKMSKKVPIVNKVCPVCKKTKLPNKFGVLSAARDGLQSRCKECVVSYNAARRKKQPKT